MVATGMLSTERAILADSGMRNYLRRVPNDCVLYLPGLDYGNWHTTVIKDYSGQANDGTITGAITKVLPSGLAYLESDGDDYINLPDSFDALDEGTLLSWIYLTESGIHHDLWASAVGSVNDYLTFYPKNDQKLQFRVKDIGGTMLVGVETNNALSILTWYLIGLTVSASGNAIFVNGVQQAVTYADGSASTQAFFNTVRDTQQTFIGRWYYDGTYYARAKMKHCLHRILTKPLSVAQMLDIYNQEYPFFQ